MQPRIFTNDSIDQSPTWQTMTRRLGFAPDTSGPARSWRALNNAVFAARSLGENDIVILTDSHGLSATFLGLLENLKRRRPTLIRTDPLLTPTAWRLADPLRRAYLRAALHCIDRIIVWAPAVIDRYAHHFGIPRAKMTAHRFHHTLQGYDYAVSTGDYIFSGGDSMRDYATLFRAVEGLKMPVVIATRLKIESSIKVPPNVTIKPVSNAEFRRLLAGARLVVVPLRMDRIRTSGQQSYLNAMALGKPVIVTDIEDAPFHIEHRRTGLLTPSGHVPALREAMGECLDSPGLTRSMGAAARDFALPLDQEHTWASILRLVLETHQHRCEKRPPGPAGAGRSGRGGRMAVLFEKGRA
jgi:glycosyltransferase involved in cell wall biosynthesis